MPTKSDDKGPPRKPCILILGLGYVGSALARELLAKNWRVIGTSRLSDEVSDKIVGIETVLLDTSTPQGVQRSRQELGNALLQATHVIATAPVSKATGIDPFIHDFGAQISTAAVVGGIQWAGYLSTTSVYGNHDGDWVDEETPTNPTLKRGQLRVNAERHWALTGLPMHTFRLPGIYGPNRGTLNKVLQGKARCVVKENQYFSRIHVEDIVQTVIASTVAPNPSRVYNVVDNLPVPSHVVTEYCCELLGQTPPPRESLEDANLSKMARTFYTDSKRVRNSRIRQELGVELRYPTYKEGLTYDIGQMTHAKQKSRAKSARNILEILLRPLTVTIQFSCQVCSFFLNFISNLWKDVQRMFVSSCRDRKCELDELTCLLVDNGSLKPEPTLVMRRLAESIMNRTGVRVVPVSARFANRISAEKLNGQKAHDLKGPSNTVTKFVPETIAACAATHSTSIKVNYKIAPVLFSPVEFQNSNETVSTISNNHLSRIMLDMVKRTVAANNLASSISQHQPLRVVLVDHGSPSIEVNAVRRGLTALLRILLLDEYEDVIAIDSSMERRDDPYYDFNKPLLEDLFSTPGWNAGDVVLVYAFLCPGRHAGPGGDIETILDQVQLKHPKLRIHKTGLIADDENHSELTNLLVDKLSTVVELQSSQVELHS